ncbi:secreted phosphoprotein 24-like isoform X2 [Narcine bancroftii]|uniref:secreted phosphoprotein 24-like isoform X2 n=1 Tax=Narcine bancroftii TaxID=1343680 RepID=UPI003831AC58
MKSFLLAIAAVQILHCSGVPSTKDALRTSVVKLNEITEITNLCGITKRGITNTYRTGKLSYNVDLTFSVKETVCSKSSRLEFDDPSCQFRPQKIAEGGFCKSHVEYLADKVSDIDVECEGLKTVDSESDSTESNITKIEDKTQSTETSLEEPSNMETSKETSVEEIYVKTQSKETSLEETLDAENMSSELSQEEFSNEQNGDLRAQH